VTDTNRAPARLHPDVAPYRRPEEGTHPPLLSPEYASTVLRAPKDPLVWLPHTLSEVTGPLLGEGRLGELDHDLTRQHAGEPLGERVIVHGRVLEGDGRPVPNTLVEVWQANSAGRYLHEGDQHPAPLDPNFTGVGRALTDEDGWYKFTTIQPGPYPWAQHSNAWRPAHIHFSVFGSAFTQRLVTQMYFPSDPLFPYDPILQSVTDDAARQRLVATYVHEKSVPEFSMGYQWDIVLDGPNATWMEEGR
jgi:protocatechuate 3,4-dioxygenase beta subunit